MKTFEIINPSDPYTLYSNDFKVAAAAVLLLGEGHYGMENVEDEEEEMPIFLFGGTEAWLKDQGMDPFGKWLEEHYDEVAAALETVTIGSVEDRRKLERVLACISNPEEREKARAAYHDDKRSSMNDIGKRAGQLAARIRTIKNGPKEEKGVKKRRAAVE